MRDLKSFVRTPRSTGSTKAAILVAATCFLGTTSAHADTSADASTDNKQKARAAYARATEANERGDYVSAARELALADELAPNPVTLKAALEATLDADAAVLGMELVARADKRGESDEIADVVASVRKRFSGRTGRFLVICPGTTSCQATLDGEAIAVASECFALTGKHRVIVSQGTAVVQREIDVLPMGLTTVNGPEQRLTSVAPGAHVSQSGLSSAWFVTGMITTIAAGVGTSISGASTKEKHEAFVVARCAEPGPAPTCTQLASDGQSAQTRTNVLAGVTAALGLTTIVLGFVTFTKKNPASTLSLEPRKDGAFARLVVVLP